MMYSVAPRNARGSGACVPGCVPGAFPTVPVRKIVPTLRVPCGFTQLLPVSILVHTVSILSFPACAQKALSTLKPDIVRAGCRFSDSDTFGQFPYLLTLCSYVWPNPVRKYIVYADTRHGQRLVSHIFSNTCGSVHICTEDSLFRCTLKCTHSCVHESIHCSRK